MAEQGALEGNHGSAGRSGGHGGAGSSGGHGRWSSGLGRGDRGTHTTPPKKIPWVSEGVSGALRG